MHARAEMPLRWNALRRRRAQRSPSETRSASVFFGLPPGGPRSARTPHQDVVWGSGLKFADPVRPSVEGSMLGAAGRHAAVRLGARIPDGERPRSAHWLGRAGDPNWEDVFRLRSGSPTNLTSRTVADILPHRDPRPPLENAATRSSLVARREPYYSLGPLLQRTTFTITQRLDPSRDCF